MADAPSTPVKKQRQPRKPKVPAASSLVASSAFTEVKAEAEEAKAEVEPKAEVEVEPKAKAKATRAKKEKKPIQVVAVVTSDGIEGTFTPEARRPLIVHFPFNSTEVKFSDVGLQYDPSPPPLVQPYDANSNYFQVNTEGSSAENQIGVELEGWRMSLEDQMKKQEPVFPEKQQQQEQQQQEQQKQQEQKTSSPILPVTTNAIAKPVTNDPKQTNYLVEKQEKAQLLKCYSVDSRGGRENFVPPSSTKVHCFWCAHAFEGTPCFLPVKEESGSYHVYGNYCTPQCALAYLLYEHLDSHVRWERMALLHRMYKCNGRLYPAPPRESLVSFGGIYTIEDFRQIISVNKVRVDVQVPPMVSILWTLDTKPIDFYDSSLQNTFAQGFSMDRFKAWSEQGGALRLKRSKPLKDHESTLDACIHISVKRGGE
jgi:hypothetical protein